MIIIITICLNLCSIRSIRFSNGQTVLELIRTFQSYLVFEVRFDPIEYFIFVLHNSLSFKIIHDHSKSEHAVIGLIFIQFNPTHVPILNYYE